ncbi:MAG: DsbA family protein [Gemmatimonadetes bacterium]|nr:DsbA family protein [Gemmatimonadota bacterium]
MEFSDFQCPYCGQLAARLDSARTMYADRLSTVHRHFPVRSAASVTAAHASECAAQQGRFWEMRSELYSDQDAITRGRWNDLAERAGVNDLQAFNTCMALQTGSPSLAADIAAGRRLRVQATPTIFINGTRIVGAPPMEDLIAHIELAISAGQSIP